MRRWPASDEFRSGLSRMGKAGSNSRGDEPRKGGSKSASSRKIGRSESHASGGSNGAMKFVIDSDLSQQRDLQKRILDAVETAGYHPDSVFAVKISLEEALINAIKHGNKLDPKKKVHVHAVVSPDM